MVLKHIVSLLPYLFYLFYLTIYLFKLTLPCSLFLKWLIFITLIALLYIFLLSLLSFTLIWLHYLHLKCPIFIILMALLYIFLLPGPYPFNLFQFVVSVIFYINLTSLLTCKKSYLYYPDGSTIYFLTSRTLPIQSLPTCYL